MTPLRKLIVIVFATSLLAACATRPASNPALNEQLSWNKRQQGLICVKKWQVAGQTAIHTPKENITAALNWEQNGIADYDLTLLGPLGSGSMHLTKDHGTVHLKTSEGIDTIGGSAEEVMLEQLQWSLPVSHLFYWVRGLPAPGIHSTTKFDNYNHLTMLTQEGWQIDYKRYTGVDGLDLPSKIFMVHNDIRVRLIISQWHIENSCA